MGQISGSSRPSTAGATSSVSLLLISVGRNGTAGDERCHLGEKFEAGARYSTCGSVAAMAFFATTDSFVTTGSFAAMRSFALTDSFAPAGCFGAMGSSAPSAVIVTFLDCAADRIGVDRAPDNLFGNAALRFAPNDLTNQQRRWVVGSTR